MEQEEESDAAGMRRGRVETRDRALANGREGAAAPFGIDDGWQKLVPPPHPTLSARTHPNSPDAPSRRPIKIPHPGWLSDQKFPSDTDAAGR